MQEPLDYVIDFTAGHHDRSKTPETIVAHAKFLGLEATFFGDDNSLLRISGRHDQAEQMAEFFFFMDPSGYSHRITDVRTTCGRHGARSNQTAQIRFLSQIQDRKDQTGFCTHHE